MYNEKRYTNKFSCIFPKNKFLPAQPIYLSRKDGYGLNDFNKNRWNVFQSYLSAVHANFILHGKRVKKGRVKRPDIAFLGIFGILMKVLIGQSTNTSTRDYCKSLLVAAYSSFWITNFALCYFLWYASNAKYS